MKLLIIIFFISTPIFAQSFNALEDGSSKYERINNIEDYLKKNSDNVSRHDQALIAQKNIILDLQKKIDQLVDKQIILETHQKQQKSTTPDENLSQRVSDIESKIIKLQDEQIKKLQDQVKEMDLAIKTLQDLIKVLEKKIN